jgi:hypothetical protein
MFPLLVLLNSFMSVKSSSEELEDFYCAALILFILTSSSFSFVASF